MPRREFAQILVTTPNVHVLVHARPFRLGRREHGVRDLLIEVICIGHGLRQPPDQFGPDRLQSRDRRRKVKVNLLDRSLIFPVGSRWRWPIGGADLTDGNPTAAVVNVGGCAAKVHYCSVGDLDVGGMPSLHILGVHRDPA